jgi:hypothetical protein
MLKRYHYNHHNMHIELAYLVFVNVHYQLSIHEGFIMVFIIFSPQRE